MSMSLPTPTLDTARLRLRPFDKADADHLFALHSSARVLRYWDAPDWSERERAERFSDDDLLVVPARELFTGSWRNRKHVLALDLEAPVPDFLTFEGTIAELERQDAVVLAPFVDSLSQEIGRALQYFFTSTPHHKVHYVMLAGGTATLPGLKDRVTELTGFASMVV